MDGSRAVYAVVKSMISGTQVPMMEFELCQVQVV